MNLCFRRIFVVILVALAWAVVWSPVGVLTGLMVDPGDSLDEMWVAIGAYPGFLCGAVFSAAIGIAEGRRGLDGLTLSRVAGWGAVSGLLVGALPFLLGTVNPALPLWLWGVVTVGAVTILSSASAVGTAWVARMAKKEEYIARRRGRGVGIARSHNGNNNQMEDPDGGLDRIDVSG